MRREGIMNGIIIFCFFSLLSSVCFADMVYLNDGQVISGEIVSQGTDFVVVDGSNGNQETIATQYIRRIVKERHYRAYRPAARSVYGLEPGDEEWIFKLGVDFNGRHEVSNSRLSVLGSQDSAFNNTQNVNSGISWGSEYISYISKNFGVGGGLTIQSPRGLSGNTGNFDFAPLYALVKFRTTPDARNKYEYLSGQVGYNLFEGDRNYAGDNASFNGGLYFGLGAGIVINRIQIELLYTEDRGSVQDSGYQYNSTTGNFDYYSESGDIMYSKLGLSIGFIF
jgi:hypothetical protein